MPACRYMEEIGLVAMLATKRLAGIKPELNLREHVTCMPLPSMNKVVHSGFDTQRRRNQKSKTGASVAAQKGLLYSKKRVFSMKSLLSVSGWLALY